MSTVNRSPSELRHSIELPGSCDILTEMWSLKVVIQTQKSPVTEGGVFSVPTKERSPRSLEGSVEGGIGCNDQRRAGE